MKRRLLAVAVSVAGTFAVAAWLDAALNWLLCGLLLAAAVPMIWLRYTRERTATLVLFCSGVAFAAFGAWTALTWEQAQRYDGQTVWVQATVEQVTYGKDAGTAILYVRQGMPKGTRIEVTDASLQRYDAVQARLTVHIIQNKGLAFHRSRAKGVYLYASSVSECAVHRQADKPWYALFTQLGDRLQNRLLSWLPDERGALLGAVCLGNKEMLASSTVSDFRAAGLSHLLALSGLHLSVLQGVIYGALRRLRLSKRGCAAVTVALVWMFVLTVGPSASLLRAAVMTSLAMAARMLFLRVDALNSLGVALLLLLLIDPYSIYDEGLLLSFGATLGILLFYPPWHRMVKRWLQDKGQAHCITRRLVGLVRGLCNGIGLSLTALVFTLPLTVLLFGSVAWITPLSNLLAVPVMSAAVSLGFAALPLLAIPVLEYAAPLLLLPAAWLTDAGIHLAHLFASVAWMPWMGAVLTAALLVGSMWWFWRKKDKEEAQYDAGTTESTDQERRV